MKFNAIPSGTLKYFTNAKMEIKANLYASRAVQKYCNHTKSSWVFAGNRLQDATRSEDNKILGRSLRIIDS
jgi:hypothetical protein